MMSFQFWRRWLMVVTGGVILYGFGLILLPELTRNFFTAMFFGSTNTADVFSDEATAYITFVHGVLGAVIIGWMLTFMSILRGFSPDNSRNSWNTLVLAVALWYLIDTGFSLYVGIVAHALFNTIFLVLFAIPLAAMYRYFLPGSHQ